MAPRTGLSARIELVVTEADTAEAFRSGRLGVMDYYKMENIQADTAIRGSIAHPEGKK